MAPAHHGHLWALTSREPVGRTQGQERWAQGAPPPRTQRCGIPSCTRRPTLEPVTQTVAEDRTAPSLVWRPEVRTRGAAGPRSLKKVSGRLLPASRRFRWPQESPGLWPQHPMSASAPTRPPLSAPLRPRFSLIIGTQRGGSGPPHPAWPRGHLIPSAKTPFPNKATFTGPQWTLILWGHCLTP